MSISSEFRIVPIRMSPNSSVCKTDSELSHIINNIYVHVSSFRFESPWATNKTNIGVSGRGGGCFHTQVDTSFTLLFIKQKRADISYWKY
jgi:hypothetical protein